MAGNDHDDETLTAEENPAAAQLRKRALIEAVAAASGQKLPVVRAVTDALLQQLAAALDRGEALALPPLGRLTVARRKEADDGAGPMLVLRLKRAKPGAGAAAGPDTDGGDA